MHLCSLNVPRSRGGRLVLLGVALLLSGVVGTAQAQHLDNGFYGKLGAGLSGYTGDLAGPRAGAPQEFGADAIGRLPLVAVGELGYQLSPRWGLALGGQAGSYVSVGNAAPATDSYRRYTSHLLGRYTFGAPDRRVAFYLDAGLNVTAGGPTHTGIGPSVGGGIDIRAGRAVSLYVESRLHATVPDDAVDGRGRGAEGWSFDTVNQPLGFGLRFSLTTPTAPEIIALDAPAEVEAGTTATFTVTINEEEAARPLDRRWRFGDGTEGTGRTVTHTYRRPGTYPVTVSAHNEAGEATASTTIRVTRASPPPVASGGALGRLAHRAPQPGSGGRAGAAPHGRRGGKAVHLPMDRRRHHRHQGAGAHLHVRAAGPAHGPGPRLQRRGNPDAIHDGAGRTADGQAALSPTGGAVGGRRRLHAQPFGRKADGPAVPESARRRAGVGADRRAHARPGAPLSGRRRPLRDAGGRAAGPRDVPAGAAPRGVGRSA